MSISKTLTFSKAAKFPVPERVQENVKAINFSKSIGNNTLGASLSLLSKKDKEIIKKHYNEIMQLVNGL